MKKRIGYRQSAEHFNRMPELRNKISELSQISTCRYDPKAPKATCLSEVLQRPLKYNFDVVIQLDNSATFFKHVCFFDDVKDAEAAHQKLRLQLYDQKTKPYLDKLNKRKHLKLFEKDTVLDITDEADILKKLT